MPRKRNPWFRFYVEAVHDRKLRRQDPAIRWLWVAILAVARESPLPGTLLLAETGGDSDPLDEHDLADVAALDVADVKDGLAEYQRLGMIDRADGAWRVVRWGDRQFESDDVTQRTRKHRTKEQGRNVPTSFDGTPPETETETENPETTARAGARARQPARGKTALPTNWQPNDTHHTIADELDRDLTREAADFRDYCQANDRRYKDWDAAFRKWLRNDRYRPPVTTAPAVNGGRTFLTANEQRSQRSREARAAALAEFEQMGLP